MREKRYALAFLFSFLLAITVIILVLLTNEEINFKAETIADVKKLESERSKESLLSLLRREKDVLKKEESNNDYDCTIMTGDYSERKHKKFAPQEMFEDIKKKIKESSGISELKMEIDKSEYWPLEGINFYGIDPLKLKCSKVLTESEQKIYKCLEKVDIEKELIDYKEGRYKDYVEIETMGDGNCVLYSIAVMLTGNDGFWKKYQEHFCYREDAFRLRVATIIYVIKYYNSDKNLREYINPTGDEIKDLEKVRVFLSELMNIMEDRTHVDVMYFHFVIGAILRRSIVWISIDEEKINELVYFANNPIDKTDTPWVFLFKDIHSRVLLPKSLLEE